MQITNLETTMGHAEDIVSAQQIKFAQNRT